MVADLCRAQGLGRYVIWQEEKFADKKRTDVRFVNMAFGNSVPVELKLANRCRAQSWSSHGELAVQ